MLWSYRNDDVGQVFKVFLVFAYFYLSGKFVVWIFPVANDEPYILLPIIVGLVCNAIFGIFLFFGVALVVKFGEELEEAARRWKNLK